MKCPWLIESFTTTHTEYSGKESKRIEKRTFGECHKSDCPFYCTERYADSEETIEHCTRITNNSK